MDAPKVVVDGLCKVFGSNPQQALDMLAAGATKDEVLKRTGQVVGVHDVSFDVQEGEIFVLMGLSGSGKSTLIRLVNRLVDPSAGKVTIDGLDVASARRSALTALRRKDMNMVFQSFALMPQRNVLSNTAFGLEVAGVGKKERERRAMEVLEQVGLATFSHKLPSELSGGMHQRVGLAHDLRDPADEFGIDARQRFTLAVGHVDHEPVHDILRGPREIADDDQHHADDERGARTADAARGCGDDANHRDARRHEFVLGSRDDFDLANITQSEELTGRRQAVTRDRHAPFVECVFHRESHGRKRAG